MGGKYEIRYEIEDEFVPYTSVYRNSFLEFLKIMIMHKNKIIYFTIRF